MSEPVLFFTGEQAKKSTREKRSTKGAVEALELLKSMTEHYRENLAASGKDDGEPRVMLKDWRQAFYNSLGKAKPDTKQKTFVRAFAALESTGEIYVSHGFVYLGESPQPDKTRQNRTMSGNVRAGQSDTPDRHGQQPKGCPDVRVRPGAVCPDESDYPDKLPDDDEYWIQADSVIPSGESQDQERPDKTGQTDFVRASVRGCPVS